MSEVPELDVGLQRAPLSHTAMQVKAGCVTSGCSRPCAPDRSWCPDCLARLGAR